MNSSLNPNNEFITFITRTLKENKDFISATNLCGLMMKNIPKQFYPPKGQFNKWMSSIKNIEKNDDKDKDMPFYKIKEDYTTLDNNINVDQIIDNIKTTFILWQKKIKFFRYPQHNMRMWNKLNSIFIENNNYSKIIQNNFPNLVDSIKHFCIDKMPEKPNNYKLDSIITQEPTITPQTRPTITPQTRPIITPQHQQVITPQTRPVITPQTRPIITPQTQAIITPQTRPDITSQTRPNITSQTRPIIIPQTQQVISQQTRPIINQQTRHIFNQQGEQVFNQQTQQLINTQSSQINNSTQLHYTSYSSNMYSPENIYSEKQLGPPPGLGFDEPRTSILFPITNNSISVDNQQSLLFPKNIRKNDLDLSWTDIESLPDGLIVGGDLFLTSCRNLESLPKGLKVGGYLIIEDSLLEDYSNAELKRMIKPGHIKKGIDRG